MNWITKEEIMNRNIHELRLLIILLISMTIPVFASPHCGPCQVQNPDKSLAQGTPCVDKQGRKCGTPGTPQRTPDVDVPTSECGVCGPVVTTVVLAKCENSTNPCDTCAEQSLKNKITITYKCKYVSPEDIFYCRDMAITNYRGDPDPLGCDLTVVDVFNCLADLIDPDHPEIEAYLCAIEDCNCANGCEMDQETPGYGMGCGGGL